MFFEYVLEHGFRIELRAVGERAVRDRFAPCGRDLLLALFRQHVLAFVRPLAERDQVRLQALDRIAQRPMFVIILGSIARRIVAGGMRSGAISHMFDQRWAGAHARAFGSPLRYCIHREEIVAVDANARNAIARAASRERAAFAAGERLEGRDRPLIVDDVEDHRRLVDLREQQRVVKVRFGGAAIAEPAGGDVIFALDRRRHGPAHGLRKLRREIAGDGKQIAFDRVIHHRQLPALAHVLGVRQQLAHQVDEAAAARDLQALVAIGRKQHVARAHRHALRHRHRFLAGGLDVERDLSLALRAVHAIVEHARQQHVAQAQLQIGGREMRVPGADRAMLVVEHADHVLRQRFGCGQRRIRIGPRDGARG